MAINDQNGLLTGAVTPQWFIKTFPATVSGRLMSGFYSAGMPGAAVAPTPGLSGAALTNYSGQLPFTNPATGETRFTLFNLVANIGGACALFDRLWHNSGIIATQTTAQTINSVAWPARDLDESINGRGVMIALEVSAVMGAGAPLPTLVYTNSADVAGRSITGLALPTAMPAGSLIILPQAPGDYGVKSVQTFTKSLSMVTGTMHLVALRQLTPWEPAGGPGMNALKMGFPKLPNNIVPFPVWMPSTTTAPIVYGQYGYSQG